MRKNHPDNIVIADSNGMERRKTAKKLSMFHLEMVRKRFEEMGLRPDERIEIIDRMLTELTGDTT